MAQIILTTREGDTQTIEGTNGDSVMETLRNAGVDEIMALCGGQCSCATCHVYVDEADFAQLSPLSPYENDLLEGSGHRRTNSRLSCQVRLSGDLDQIHVTVAPED